MKENLHHPGHQPDSKQARSFFQPKLTINQPGDVYEQEADAMADKVMRMKDNTPNTFFKPAVLPIQRKCTHGEADEKSLQRKEVPSIQREDKAADNTGKVLSEGASVVKDQLDDQPGMEEWKKKQVEELKKKMWDQQPTELKAGLISFGLMGAGILGSAFAADKGFRFNTINFLQDKNLALPLSLLPYHEYYAPSSFKYKLPSATGSPYTFETEFEFDAFFDLMRKRLNIPDVKLTASANSSYNSTGGFKPLTGGKISLKLGGGIVNISGFYNQPLPPTPTLISNPTAGEPPMWLMRSLPGQLEDNLPKGSGIFITVDVLRIPELFRPLPSEPAVQRKENGTGRGEDAAPPIVGDVLSSPTGVPLDSTTQYFMEDRFGHDFSSVRIHTGGKAAESANTIQAKAYTSGNQIVFGNGEYQPGTDAGKHLLAHELTHVVQQNDSDPKIRRKPVSSGEYGTELNYFSTQINHVPDKVATLLMSSPTYMNMVQELDRRYLALDGRNIPYDWIFKWEPDADGVLAKGPFRGRRVLAVWNNTTGSEFMPAGALGNDYGYDIILLRPPYLERPDQEVGEWIQLIAHETTHAFTRVTSGGKAAPATAAARITAAIQDEVNTRANEVLIVSEATNSGKRLKGYQSTTGSTDPAQAQRDMFPSALKRTYLEEFVLDERIREAISKENLSQADIETHNKFVDSLTITSPDRVVQSPGFILYYNPKSQLYETFTSVYDELRYIQRVIDERWTKYEMNSLGNVAVKETILLQHATAFFKGITSYRPQP